MIDDKVRVWLRSLFMRRKRRKAKRDRLIGPALAIRAKAIHSRRQAALDHLGDRWRGRPQKLEADEVTDRRKRAAEAVRGRFGG